MLSTGLSWILSTFGGNVLGFAYPIYASFKAIQSDDAEQHSQWLMFWVVNSVFTVIEMFADILIARLPFYYEGKIAFVAWLALPQFQGAQQLFEKFLAPSFIKYETHIDKSIDVVTTHASEKLGQLCRETAQFAVKRGSGYILAGQQYLVMQALEATSPKKQKNHQKQDDQYKDTSTVRTNVETLLEGGLQFFSKVREIMPPSLTTAHMATTASPTQATEAANGNNPSKARLFSDANAKDSKQGAARLDSSTLKTTVVEESKDESVKDARETREGNLMLRQFQLLLQRGIRVKKYGGKEGPRQRILSLNATNTTIVWEPISSGQGAVAPLAQPSQRRIPLLLIQNVRSGYEFNGFQAYMQELQKSEHPPSHPSSDSIDVQFFHATSLPKAAHCFVLIARQGDLELETDSEDTRNLLVAGFRLLIATRKIQCKKAIRTFHSALALCHLQQSWLRWREHTHGLKNKRNLSSFDHTQQYRTVYL